MDSFKNNLPIAVHQVGGGDAMKRTGNLIIPLNGTITGSFSTGTANRIRVAPNLRNGTDILVLLSFSGPVSLSTAEYIIGDRENIWEYPSDTLTIHYRLIDMVMLNDRNGGANDFLCVTFYE